MTTSNKTSIQQTLVYPLDLKYAHGPIDFSEVKHMDKCRVRLRLNAKYVYWILPYNHT